MNNNKPSAFSVSYSKSRDAVAAAAAAAKGAFKAVPEEKEEEDEEDSTDLDNDDEDEEKGQRLPLLQDSAQAHFPGHVSPAPSSKHSPFPAVHRPPLVLLANGHGPVRTPTTPNGEAAITIEDIPDDDADERSSSPEDSNGNGTTTGVTTSSKGGASKTRGSSGRYPREYKKTAAAFVFMSVNMIITGISLVLTHESLPDYRPLPDQILDRVTYQKWALYGSEYLIQFQSVLAVMTIAFHKHRFIVARRSFVMVGVLYLYRAITMFVTTLPKSDYEYPCAPKTNGSLTFVDVAGRVVTILMGGGLSVNGHHIYCGDYIYSGHTMMLIIGYLVIKEYTPRRFFILHWLIWLNVCTAVILLLLSRGHYTVDVIIAYFITTRTWATYHTIAGHASLRQATPMNHFHTFWWYDGLCWLEVNVKPGKLPNEYNWPIPSKLIKACRNRMRTTMRSSTTRRKTKLAAAIS